MIKHLGLLLLNKFIKSRQRLNLFNNNNLVHSSGPAHCCINNIIIKDARKINDDFICFR